MIPRLIAALCLVSASPLLHADSCCEACTAPIKPAVIGSNDDAPPSSANTIDVGGCHGKPAPEPAPTTPPAAVGHPLRGVVIDILADRQALLVKHEEIPGVMKAMTMLLKVDAATLTAVKKGQTITATLVDHDDGWSLLDVKPVVTEN